MLSDTARDALYDIRDHAIYATEFVAGHGTSTPSSKIVEASSRPPAPLRSFPRRRAAFPKTFAPVIPNCPGAPSWAQATSTATTTTT